MVISEPEIIDSENFPQVELTFMNNTHLEEIKMVKEIGELITSFQEQNNHDANPETITQALTAWLDHTKAHFSRENNVMLETHFPAFPIHSQEHEAALNQLKSVLKDWESDKEINALAEYVFAIWPNWFNRHVETMDMMTAKFAVMNGYTEEN